MITRAKTQAQREPASVRVASRDDLLPVLLDRLTDLEPSRRHEPDGAFLLTRSLLRDAVLRDLRWLLNTANFESGTDLASLPHLRSSVVNYGIRALAGSRGAEVDWAKIECSVRKAIIDFEPRIIAESLQVQGVGNDPNNGNARQNQLALEISGQFWSIPYPVEFIFRSDIDLESGYVALRALGGAQ